MIYPCSTPGCNKRIKEPRLFCMPHWREIPSFIKYRILEHYTPGSSLMGQSNGWLLAVKDAINSTRDVYGSVRV